MKKALVLFETSGKIREALKCRGFYCISCDLLPADDGSKDHRQCDVWDILSKDERYDAIIAHPECTCLTVAGNHVYAAGKSKHQMRLDAVANTQKIWDRCCDLSDCVVLENPQGVLSTMAPNMPKPQYIQPYEFGHDASKKTGLWLKGLSKLPIDPANRVQGRMVMHKGKLVERWANQTDSGQNRLGPSELRWKLRSETYQGIADAVADLVADAVLQAA